MYQGNEAKVVYLASGRPADNALSVVLEAPTKALESGKYEEYDFIVTLRDPGTGPKNVVFVFYTSDTPVGADHSDAAVWTVVQTNAVQVLAADPALPNAAFDGAATVRVNRAIFNKKYASCKATIANTDPGVATDVSAEMLVVGYGGHRP